MATTEERVTDLEDNWNRFVEWWRQRQQERQQHRERH